MRNEIINEYFEWLCDLTSKHRYDGPISYRKLLTKLHDTEFRYLISRDGNRAEDGKDLRYRFAYNHPSPAAVETCLDGPCSVLEMMVALAIRCEENIMDDPTMGDRTQQWFWNMVVSLGLGSMYDSLYDNDYVEDMLERFLNRRYSPDGKGGLFTIRNCDTDLRDVEIWHQLCWYLDSIS